MTVNYKVVVRCCGSGGVRTSCRRVIVIFDDFYTARRGSKVSGPSVPHASACPPVFLNGLLLGDMHDDVGWAGGVYTCM